MLLTKRGLCFHLNLIDKFQELLGSSLGLALAGRLLADLVLDKGGMVRVEAQHNLLVAQGVLLLDAGALCQGSALGRTEDALDLGAVDQTGQVGLGDDVGRQQEVLLELGRRGSGAVDAVESLEGSRGPDNETAEVTTGGQLEKVQGVDRAGLDAGQVAGTGDELLAIDLGVVDDQRATALTVTAASELALTSTELLGLPGLLDIGGGANSLQNSQSGASLSSGTVLESGRVDDKGNLGDGGDLVATGEQQRGDSGSSKGGGSGESPGQEVISTNPLLFLFPFPSRAKHSLLTLVDLDVPLAPGLGRGEHATGTAHVTEGSLTSAVGTTTGDTGDTGDSTTCEKKEKKTFVNQPAPGALLVFLSTNRYPTTRQRSGDRPSRSQRRAGACSWRFQCGLAGQCRDGWGR